MPPSILHRDFFAVEVQHGKEAIAIYDSAGRYPHEHAGDFSGLSNKVHVLPGSTKPIRMRFNLLPGFDFLSGNTVLVGLTVDGKQRDFELIWKDDHEIKQPNTPSSFSWGRVLLSKASRGTMTITVTRGNKAPKVKFAALSGQDGFPYSMEIEWQLSADASSESGTEDGRQDATPTPKARVPKLAAETTKSKVMTKTKTKKALEKPRVSPEPRDTVESTEAKTEGAISAPDLSTEDTSMVPRRTQGSKTVPTNPFQAPGVDHANASKAPQASSAYSDHTPGKHPHDTAAYAGFPDVTSESAQAATNPPTLKRSASTAFDPDGANSKLQPFRLRKAQAKLAVAEAKAKQAASEVDKDDVKFLEILLSKAQAAHEVVEVELELKKAEVGGEQEPEILKLLTRKAEAYLEVVEAEEKFVLASGV